MELKEFVKDVLVQLCDGVIEAQKAVDRKEAVVNPRGVRGSDESYVRIGNKDRPLETVFFEVGLKNVGTEGKAKGVGVAFSIGGIGGKSTKETTAESVTRIKFSIPIALPSADGNNTQTAGRVKRQHEVYS